MLYSVTLQISNKTTDNILLYFLTVPNNRERFLSASDKTGGVIKIFMTGQIVQMRNIMRLQTQMSIPWKAGQVLFSLSSSSFLSFSSFCYLFSFSTSMRHILLCLQTYKGNKKRISTSSSQHPSYSRQPLLLALSAVEQLLAEVHRKHCSSVSSHQDPESLIPCSISISVTKKHKITEQKALIK